MSSSGSRASGTEVHHGLLSGRLEPGCADQMSPYMPEYSAEYNAEVVGISVDGTRCHPAFCVARRPGFTRFPTSGRRAVAQCYDMYDGETGECRRAIDLKDEKGFI